MLFASNRHYGTLSDVRKSYPAAARITRCEGGWLIFFTWFAYNMWKQQR